MALVPRDRIASAILVIRGQKATLDADLAELYGVETLTLTRAVNRNRDRFPSDFAFQPSKREAANLRSRFGISGSWGGRRYPPNAFTEQGVAMLSSVLRSKRAAQVNVEIMRTFVKLRAVLASHDELLAQLQALERRYDRRFKVVFDAIRQLMAPPSRPKKPIGSCLFSPPTQIHNQSLPAHNLSRRVVRGLDRDRPDTGNDTVGDVCTPLPRLPDRQRYLSCFHTAQR